MTQYNLGSYVLGIKKGRVALEVRIKVGNENVLLCFIKEKTDLSKLVNKTVSVMLRSEEDYLYITGQVDGNMEKGTKTVSVRILKACWFVRKTKGALSWLQKKHIYDTCQQDSKLEMAS